MSDVTRRRGLAGVIFALLAICAAPAQGAAPEGPRLAFVRLAGNPPSLKLLTADAAGLAQQTLAGGSLKARPLPFPLEAPSWSPDGAQIAFSAVAPGQRDTRIGGLRIFLAAADGSGVTEVPGSQGGISPVFAPDGHTIAFARIRERVRRTPHGGERTTFRSTSTWLVDLNGGGARALTPWRNHLQVSPTSFSPDSATLALTRSNDVHIPEVVLLNLASGRTVVLERAASDAVYSPDGSQIAYLSLHQRPFLRHGKIGTEVLSDLFTMRADGTHRARLTDTKRKIETWPSWDPSGQRLAFARLNSGFGESAALGLGDAIEEINADGSCAKTVLSSPQLAFYGPVWQPGVGREAGPIAC